MQGKKPFRNHVVIVTSDAEDAGVKQFRIRPWILETIILLLCVIIGAMVGYLAYEEKIWETAIRKNNERIAAMEELEQENLNLKKAMEEREAELNAEIDSLNDKIVVLGTTLDQKIQSENELLEELNKQTMPTEFPINGPAKLEEAQEGEEGDPVCIFTIDVANGVSVVATASGTVTAIEDDAQFGRAVRIDHGNGYVTVYRNQGVPNVKIGDTVVQGAPLFAITRKNKKFGYQILLEEQYINPMDMLSING